MKTTRWRRILLLWCLLLVNIILAFRTWRSERSVDILSITQSLLVLVCIFETDWPKGSFRPKSVRVTLFAMYAATFVLLSMGIWRQGMFRQRGEREQVVPVTLQITPDRAVRGQAHDVTISASSLHVNPESLPHFGAGIKVLSARAVTENSLSARIAIAADTAAGRRRIWVSTPGARTTMDDSASGAFEVLAPLAAAK